MCCVETDELGWINRARRLDLTQCPDFANSYLRQIPRISVYLPHLGICNVLFTCWKSAILWCTNLLCFHNSYYKILPAQKSGNRIIR